jgi:hypothetical protein
MCWEIIEQQSSLFGDICKDDCRVYACRAEHLAQKLVAKYAAMSERLKCKRQRLQLVDLMFSYYNRFQC